MPGASRLTRADAEALDAADELAAVRAEFLLPRASSTSTATPRRAPRRAAERLREWSSREWGQDLIRSWNATAGSIFPGAWRPDRPLIGASADEVAVADSTSSTSSSSWRVALRLDPGGG